jgi:hypothetical protein
MTTKITPTLPVLLKIGKDDLADALRTWSTAHSDTWFYKKGESNVTLVGHIDTSHEKRWNVKTEIWNPVTYKFDPRPNSCEIRNTSLYYDNKRQTFWSPDGLGADDRAGVFLMLHAYNAISPKPNLLFTDLEESGGQGAQDAAKELKDELLTADLFIEWDRKGANDAVFYRDEPDDFRKYICSFGFKEEKGSFTDVAILSRELEICAVNLSVGYYDQHTFSERLDVREMWHSYSRGKQIILDASEKKKKWPNPKKPVTPTDIQTHRQYYRNYGEEDYYLCNYGFWPEFSRHDDGRAAILQKEARRYNAKKLKWQKKWSAIPECDLNSDPMLRAQKEWEENLLVQEGGGRIHVVGGRSI